MEDICSLALRQVNEENAMWRNRIPVPTCQSCGNFTSDTVRKWLSSQSLQNRLNASQQRHLEDKKTKLSNLWVVCWSEVVELDHKTPEKRECDDKAKNKKCGSFLVPLLPLSVLLCLGDGCTSVGEEEQDMCLARVHCYKENLVGCTTVSGQFKMCECIKLCLDFRSSTKIKAKKSQYF